MATSDNGPDNPEPKTSFLLADPTLLQVCTPALSMIEAALKRTTIEEFCAAIRMHYFPQSEFVGPYERAGISNGVLVEQWLYQYRELIRGRVLDMSGVRHWNALVYDLDAVEEVVVSDLSEPVVEKLGHSTEVDVIGDFASETLPMEPESLDTILCLSILEHCADPFQMVDNLARLVRAGGHIFIECPFAYTDGHLNPDNWRFCRNGYVLLARKAGLEVVDTGGYGDYSSFASVLFGRPIGSDADNGIPWNNWAICRKP
jgi:SAM-dependent methyltransferase